MRFILIVIVGVVAGLLSSVATAHQQKEAYTTVLFNQRTGNIEISHRFLMHDAEHVLGLLFKGNHDLLQSELTRKRFADYIESKFSIADKQRQSLQLETVGNEVDGKFFWVYQETEIPEQSLSQKLYLKHSALQEVWPKQINHINVERGKTVKSLRLSQSDGGKWSHVSFASAQETRK